MNIKNIKTLEEVQREYYNNKHLYQNTRSSSSLENSDGSNSSVQDSVERPRKRMRTHQDDDEKYDNRTSRLVLQFYSHQLPGIENDDSHDLRLLLKNQKKLERESLNAMELVNSALTKLINAFPKTPMNTDATTTGSQAHQFSENIIDYSPKCPTRFLESSIAVMLEHMEGLPVHFTSNDNKKLLLP